MTGKCGKCGQPVKNGHNALTCGKTPPPTTPTFSNAPKIDKPLPKKINQEQTPEIKKTHERFETRMSSKLAHPSQHGKTQPQEQKKISREEQLARYEGLSLRSTEPFDWSDQELVDEVNNNGVRLVVLDVETTSLVPHTGSVTEIAWYDVGDEVSGCFVPPHSLAQADEKALEISRYHERIAGQPQDGEQIKHLHRILGGDGSRVRFVAANPTFDIAHLNQMFEDHGLSRDPWHYMPYDVLSVYYGVSDRPAGGLSGLAKISDDLGVDKSGHHDAWHDVIMESEVLHIIEKRRREAFRK